MLLRFKIFVFSMFLVSLVQFWLSFPSQNTRFLMNRPPTSPYNSENWWGIRVFRGRTQKNNWTEYWNCQNWTSHTTVILLYTRRLWSKLGLASAKNVYNISRIIKYSSIVQYTLDNDGKSMYSYPLIFKFVFYYCTASPFSSQTHFIFPSSQHL